MTTFGIQIGWLALRVTVFTCCAAPVVWWSARRAARSAVIVLSAAMVIVLALSLVAFCPAPHFGDWAPFRADLPAGDSHRPNTAAVNDEPLAGGLSLAMLWTAFAEISRQAPESPAWRNTGAILSSLYVLGIAVAGGRLAFGWLSVQALRRRSRTITDANVRRDVSVLQRRLSCSRPVELRECDEPGLAATVGYWRPVIFLPPEWRQWTDEEMQTVLAHELAHVRHGDYLSGFLTRICQALHFYHPLVYWLSTQLRWQQELAADDLAAAALDETNHYVKSLASLALRSPARTPAMAMPYSAISGGTLLRRIAMLRGTRKLAPLSWRMRGLLIGALAGAGMFLASLGGSRASSEPAAANLEPFEIGYLPSYARGLFAIRPAFVMEQPGMENAKAKLGEGIRWLRQKGFTAPDELRPENIEQIVADVGMTSAGTGAPQSRAAILGSSSIYIRLKQEFDWPSFFKKLSNELAAATKTNQTFEVEEIQDEGVTIYKLGVIQFLGPRPVLFSMVDRRSVVFCGMSRDPVGPGPITDAKYLGALIRNGAQARGRDWGSFPQVSQSAIAVVGDNHDRHYSKTVAKDVPPEILAGIDNVRFATFAIEVGDGKPVRLILDAKSAEAAAEVEKQVNAVFDKGMRESEQIERSNKADKVMQTVGKEWHRSRKIHLQGARIEWLGYSSVRLADLFAASFDDEKRSGAETDQPKRKETGSK